MCCMRGRRRTCKGFERFGLDEVSVHSISAGREARDFSTFSFSEADNLLYACAETGGPRAADV